MLTKVKYKVAAALAEFVSDLSVEEILKMLENPKDISHGHLALPVFQWSKIQRKAPAVIAEEISRNLKSRSVSEFKSVEGVGGYVNVTLTDEYLQQVLWTSLSIGAERLGFSTAGQGQTLVIDYSSPNVAKPMSIGHLRATVIGQALRNLAETQGYKVIGINYLGDWGVQFGKLAWAYEEWGGEYSFEEKPFESLYKIYVRFHEEAENNPELERQGAVMFKRLEEGDPRVQAIWKNFLEISLKEYQKIYDLLGIKFDLILGESFFNDKLDSTVELVRQKGLLQESEGAQVVFLEENKPPCLLRKSDGTSLYATRDLASAIYRKEVLGADEILYVVGMDQTLHFQQVFSVLRKMNYTWWDHCHHIGFGMYRFKDIGRMSTRRGNVIFMEDVVRRAIDLVESVMETKNPDLPQRREIAQQVGVGAIIFNDLMNDRLKNVDFDWTKVLDFEGDSGPYVQYSFVRCQSLFRKWGKTEGELGFQATLSSMEERELIKQLLMLPEVFSVSYRTFKPNILAQYLLDVCGAFNHFYHHHRILGEQASLEVSRMTLVWATARVLDAGMKVLGVPRPQAM